MRPVGGTLEYPPHYTNLFRDFTEVHMHFRWPHNPSPKKILKEIEEILTDALTILSCNTDLITDEEQKSFSQEFSRCRAYFALSRMPPSHFRKAHKRSCRIEQVHGVPQVDRGTG